MLCGRQRQENDNTSHRLDENVCKTGMIMECYPQYKENF